MIRIAAFQGEIPRMIPRLLGGDFAQVAMNTKLENGALLPLHGMAAQQTFASPMKSFCYHDGRWLGFDAAVKAVTHPIDETRLYYTGDGAPKMRVGDTVYPLALPFPTAALRVTSTGTVDPDLSSTLIYTYTWLTEFGEESEPAPASNELVWSPGSDIKLSGFGAPPAGRNVTKMRIYRSQNGTQGNSGMYFIAEVAVGPTFVDTSGANQVEEPLSSLDYNPPPDNLTGLIKLKHGVLAAFVGRKVYFSEPYRPHAWPEKYIITVDSDIVALALFGSSVAVLTKGRPYIIQGAQLMDMASEKIEVDLPCLSAAGVVEMGYSVAYPSPQGLVTIGQQGAVIVSDNVMTHDQWRGLNPSSIVGGYFQGNYYGSWSRERADGTTESGTFAINLLGTKPFMVRVSDVFSATWYEVGSGKLYVLTDGTAVSQWDADTEPYQTLVWRSKLFVVPTEINFGVLLVEGDDNSANVFAARVYADGRLVNTVKHMNRIIPLRAGFRARSWEIEVETSREITSITMAYDATEIAEANS